MSRPPSSSAALPIAYVVLRILIILNWLVGIAILALLVVMPNEQWIMSAFKLSPSPEAERLVMGLRAIAVIGLVTIPLNYLVLKRLLAMVETVRAGDPFVAANALPSAGDRLAAAPASATRPGHRGNRQEPFPPGASPRSRRGLFGQRLDRRAPDVHPGAGLRRRHAHARDLEGTV